MASQPSAIIFMVRYKILIKMYVMEKTDIDTGFSPLTLMGTRNLAWTQNAIKFFVQANIQDKPAALHAAGKSFTFKTSWLGNNEFNTVAYRSLMYQELPSFAEGAISKSCNDVVSQANC